MYSGTGMTRTGFSGALLAVGEHGAPALASAVLGC